MIFQGKSWKKHLGLFFLSQNFSGKRLEDTLAIAIYNLCGLNPYIDVLYWESWNYFFPSSSVLKTEFSLVGGIGLGLFIPVQTETGSLHSMLGLEVPMQEMQSPLGSGTHGGHRAGLECPLWFLSCQLQARHKEDLTLLVPQLQQASDPLSRRGAQLFWWAIAFWPGKAFCKRIRAHQLDVNQQLWQRSLAVILQPCFAVWGREWDFNE